MNRSRVAWFSLRQQLVVLVVLGLIVELASVTITASVYKSSVQTRVNSIAEAIDGQRVSGLRRAEATSQSDDYAYLKQRLQRVKAVNNDVHSLYLLARNAQGVYVLVDSEQPGSEAYLPAGETYPQASDALSAIFENGRPTVEGPNRKSGDTWLSAFAPVIDDQAYRLPAVIGMDIPATTYATLLGLAGGIPLALTMLGAILIVGRSRSIRSKASESQLHMELASVTSHELREPLAVLHWFTGHSLQSKPSAKLTRSILSQVRDSAQQLQASADDMQRLLVAGVSKYSSASAQPTDVKLIMQDVLSMHRMQAEQHRVALTLSSSWPTALVLRCDACQIKHVFVNLLSNAITYSRPDTRITIGYGRTNDGSHILSFQDHGIGIPVAEQVKVWNGSYRAANAEAYGTAGAGMGLHMSRAIIEQQGGSMWIESEENKGTTVYVSLADR